MTTTHKFPAQGGWSMIKTSIYGTQKGTTLDTQKLADIMERTAGPDLMKGAERKKMIVFKENSPL